MNSPLLRHFTTPCLMLAKSDTRTEEEARNIVTLAKLRVRADLRRGHGYHSINMSLADFERLMALAVKASA